MAEMVLMEHWFRWWWWINTSPPRSGGGKGGSGVVVVRYEILATETGTVKQLVVLLVSTVVKQFMPLQVVVHFPIPLVHLFLLNMLYSLVVDQVEEKIMVVVVVLVDIQHQLPLAQQVQ